MQKIVKTKIIGFEIIYNDIERTFELSYVFEGEDLPKKSCYSIYVPFDGRVCQVFWEDGFGDLDPVGIEFESCDVCSECEEKRE
jgi:hypothetical protein